MTPQDYSSAIGDLEDEFGDIDGDTPLIVRLDDGTFIEGTRAESITATTGEEFFMFCAGSGSEPTPNFLTPLARVTAIEVDD